MLIEHFIEQLCFDCTFGADEIYLNLILGCEINLFLTSVAMARDTKSVR